VVILASYAMTPGHLKNQVHLMPRQGVIVLILRRRKMKLPNPKNLLNYRMFGHGFLTAVIGYRLSVISIEIGIGIGIEIGYQTGWLFFVFTDN